MLKIAPIHLAAAKKFVQQHHRHNLPPTGGKFVVSCLSHNRLCGVAICGRPVGRYLDDGVTLEIYRNCTDGTKNACSKLYAACLQTAKAMGYQRVITYTLESELGTSLRASNFTFDGLAGGASWTGTRHREYLVSLPEQKCRWVYTFRKRGAA